MTDFEEAKLRLERTNAAENTVVTIGQGALKSAMLINGGGAVAMLAFVGSVWGKEGLNHDIIVLLATTIQYFAFGVLAAAFAFGTTYLTQQSYVWGYTKAGYGFQLLTLVLAMAAYFFFYIAIKNAYCSFLQYS